MAVKLLKNVEMTEVINHYFFSIFGKKKTSKKKMMQVFENVRMIKHFLILQ